MNREEILKAARKQKKVDVDYVMSQCAPNRFCITGWIGEWLDKQLCQKFQKPMPTDLGRLTWYEPMTFDNERDETERNQTKPEEKRTTGIEPDEMEWMPIETPLDGIRYLEQYAAAKVTKLRMPKSERWLELLFNGKHGLTQALLNDLFYYSPNTAYVDSERKITIVKKG